MGRSFDGVDDRIDWANVFDTTGAALTVSVLVYTSTLTPANNMYFWNSSTSGGGPGVVVLQAASASGRLQFFRNGTTGKQRDSNSGLLPSANAWHHCLATDDGTMTASGAHLYVNGSEASSYTDSNGSGESTTNTTWNIGGRGSDNNRNFSGRLAEIGVWNRALSSGEIVLLSKGYSPLFILDGLKFYAPCLGYSTELNYLGAAASTTVGTTVTEHPLTLHPAPSLILATPGAGTTNNPVQRCKRFLPEPAFEYSW